MESAVARAGVSYFSSTGGFSGQRVSARAVLSTKAAYMASLRTTNSCGRAMNLLSEAFVTRIGRALLAVLALTLAAFGPAHAQSTHIQPKLVAESPAPAPGGTTTLALTMTPDKDRKSTRLNSSH